MADVTIKVLQEATSYDLLTLDELKTMLNIPLSNASEDEMLQLWITQYSDVIATMCNRVFGQEKVAETWRGNLPPLDCYRIYLARYPIKDGDIELVQAPNGSTIDPADWELENASGKLSLLGGWAEPVTVIYTGGYLLPGDAPDALKAAAGLLIQAARVEMQRIATSGIRSIAHRESRVQFFDVTSAQSKMGSGPLASAANTVNALLYKYMRINV
jgi:hypothetical protein